MTANPFWPFCVDWLAATVREEPGTCRPARVPTLRHIAASARLTRAASSRGLGRSAADQARICVSRDSDH
jgi:hypothetical protein